MRCFSDVVNGVWVFVEDNKACMPQKDVPCDHACEKCPRDVDECADGSHDCAIGQTCINHIGVAPGRQADRASFQVGLQCKLYIDDGDGCWRPNVLVTTMRCW